MNEKDIIGRQIEAKKLITECMENDERCRNDDNYLITRVWKKQGIDFYINPNHISIMFNPETIIRNRALIQNNEGKLLPTKPDVLIKRKIKEEVLRKYYSNDQKILNEWTDIKYGVK